MRFTRDKRGYENTFVVHTGGARRRGKGRPRILYWFRTPPGVRVGRSALDESAIRLIEQHNPDVEFDWTRILKGQESTVETAGPSPDRRARPRRDFPVRSAPQPSSPDQQRHRQPSAPPAEPGPGSAAALAAPAGGDAADALVEEVSGERDGAEPAAITDASDPVAPDAEVTAISAEGVDESIFSSTPSPTPRDADGETTTAARARLGSEGLLRLRARHAEVLARISETVTDPVRRDELKSQAERLNPDTWVTDAEVSQGLESYETVFESLRSVVGRPNRRRRRPGRRPGPGGPTGNPNASATGSGEEGSDPGDVGEDL